MTRIGLWQNLLLFSRPTSYAKALQMFKSQDKERFYKFQSYLNTIVEDSIYFPLGTYPVKLSIQLC